MRGKMMQRVLVADADRKLQEAYHEYLYRFFFHIETAPDGLECIAKLRAHLPDLLILDLEMPWGGGDGVLEIMRGDDDLRRVPVILTSSRVIPEEFMTFPVINALVKPVDVASLLSGTVFADEPASDPGLHVPEERIVLVVDDEPSVRKMLQRHLQQQGFQVWTAAGGAEAIDLFELYGEQIALVLLDIRMPAPDGPHTMDRLLECNPDLPVILMTGDSGEYQLSDLISRGANQVFMKPFNLKKITQVVKNHVSGSRDQVALHRG